MANKQVNAILSLTDRFSTPMFDVARNTKNATKEMKADVANLNKLANRVERRMDTLVKNAFKWGKRLAMAGGALSLKKGWDGLEELDGGARKVKSIAKDELGLDEIKEGLLELSGQTGVDISDLAESQYMAISSSVDPKESLKYAELAAKVAKAGFADPKDAINLIASMQNAFGTSGIENATKMADQFLHTQNRGIIEVGEMTQHYGKLIPLFSQAGVGYDQMNAGMATLTKMGMKPAEASTALAGAIRIMMKPTKQTTEALGELGLKFSAAELKANGFGGMMEKVMKATGGDMDKITKIFPNARAMLAGATLTGEEGMGAFKEILKELQSGVDGSLEEAYEVVQGSIGNQWDVLKQNLKNTNTKFYMQYEGNLAEKLQKINEWFQENPEVIQEKLTQLADAVGYFFDKVKEVIGFIVDHQGVIKPILAAIGSMYAGLKLLRGLSGLKKTLSILGKAGKYGIVLSSLGKIIIAIGIIAGLFTALYERKKKLNQMDEYIDIGLPQEQVLDEGRHNSNAIHGGEFNAKDEFMDMVDGIIEGVGRIRDKINEVKAFIEEFSRSLSIVWNLFVAVAFVIGLFASSAVLPILVVIGGAIKAIIQNIKDFVKGILQIVIGFGQIIIGILTFNGDLFKQGVENVLMGVWNTIKSIWNMIIDFLMTPVEAVVDIAKSVFEDKAEQIEEAWQSIKDFMKNPITGTVNIIRNIGSKIKDKFFGGDKVEGKYTGAMSWQGGIVQVHEKGGEILDLPGGTRIFPHDRSVRMAYEEGQKGSQGGGTPIVINFNGDLYGDDEYLINRVGNGIANKVIGELSNM